MTRERLVQRLAELETQFATCQKNAIAISGAIQLCNQLIAEYDAPPPSDDIPLEQLFPGATVVTEDAKVSSVAPSLEK